MTNRLTAMGLVLICKITANGCNIRSMQNENLISKAIKIVGLSKLASVCGIRYQSLQKWEAKGRLPRTDWTGETDYATRIEKATNGAVTRDQLLNFKRNDQAGDSKPLASTGECHA